MQCYVILQILECICHDHDVILQNDVTLHWMTWFALILRIILIFPRSQKHRHRPHSCPRRQQQAGQHLCLVSYHMWTTKLVFTQAEKKWYLGALNIMCKCTKNRYSVDYYVVTWNVKTYVSHPLKCRMCQNWLKWCSDPPPPPLNYNLTFLT